MRKETLIEVKYNPDGSLHYIEIDGKSIYSAEAVKKAAIFLEMLEMGDVDRSNQLHTIEI